MKNETTENDGMCTVDTQHHTAWRERVVPIKQEPDILVQNLGLWSVRMSQEYSTCPLEEQLSAVFHSHARGQGNERSQEERRDLKNKYWLWLPLPGLEHHESITQDMVDN